MTRDPLAAFDDAVVEAVASEADIETADLLELLRRHQAQMRDLPGAENLVYEWRKAFPWDVLVERREEAYLLTVAASVWPEFGDALDFSDAELDAVKRVHADQLTAAVDTDRVAVDTDRVASDTGRVTAADADLHEQEALIVTRP